jgi:hypothetical protein
MKRTFISLVLAVVAPFAWAQISETTTTTTTTEGNGAKGNYRTADLPFRENGHLRDTDRQSPG